MVSGISVELRQNGRNNGKTEERNVLTGMPVREGVQT